MKVNTQKNNQNILDVYDDNFIPEIKRLGTYLEKYPYIGMDTEFPGIVYPCPGYSQGFYYKYIKTNVDKLKLIQLGVSLFNEKGESPPEGLTWQFNLRFNSEKDEHSSKSINLLSSCGIDFNLLKKNGIHYSTFAEYLMISGLVLNEDVQWISFNGLSDFAYLLRLLLNNNLPEDENVFLENLNLYFPHFYDIKYLVQNNTDILKGGLNRIAQQLGVERVGEIHQAGSDSIVTAEVMFKIINNGYLSKDDIILKKNILFGVGLGTDDNETFFYTHFASNSNNNSGYNGKNINCYEQNNFFNNNLMLNNNDNFNFFQDNIINNSMNSHNSYLNNLNGNNHFEQSQGNKYPFGMIPYNDL